MHLLLVYQIYNVGDLTYTGLLRRWPDRVRVSQEAAASHWLQQTGPGAVMVLTVSWHRVVAFTVTVDSSRFLLQ